MGKSKEELRYMPSYPNLRNQDNLKNGKVSFLFKKR
ncbi:hypothetical protein JOC93_001366 [Priestia taiwanensis]|nr:hypothetical protein [Priestia taiwanensis]